MFPTKETEEKKTEIHCGQACRDGQEAFGSVEQFALWLDSELEQLVGQFAEFETDKSVRKFFSRS